MRDTWRLSGEDSECDLIDDAEEGQELLPYPYHQPSLIVLKRQLGDNLVNEYKNSNYHGRFWWQQIACHSRYRSMTLATARSALFI